MAFDSDTSFLPSDDDDLFDVDKEMDDATQSTDLNTNDAETDKLDADEDFDVDNQVQLYDGNVHPPEYYRQV